MREMSYCYDEDSFGRKREILAEGEINRYKYIILSCKLYPMIFVELPGDYRILYSNSLIMISALRRNVNVHGGFEAAIEFLDTGERHFRFGNFIGWSYNMESDYIAGDLFENHSGGKKWTTEELIKEAEYGVRQLESYEKTFNFH